MTVCCEHVRVGEKFLFGSFFQFRLESYVINAPFVVLDETTVHQLFYQKTNTVSRTFTFPASMPRWFVNKNCVNSKNKDLRAIKAKLKRNHHLFRLQREEKCV